MQMRTLLDLQPGLVKVLAATTPGGTTRFVHGPRGILAHEDNAGNWSWMVQDGRACPLVSRSSLQLEQF